MRAMPIFRVHSVARVCCSRWVRFRRGSRIILIGLRAARRTSRSANHLLTIGDIPHDRYRDGYRRYGRGVGRMILQWFAGWLARTCRGDQHDHIAWVLKANRLFRGLRICAAAI